MNKPAWQFNIRFLLALTAIVAAMLAGWQSHPLLLSLSLEVRRLFAIPFFCLAPILSLAGLVATRVVRWWICVLVGVLAPTIAYVANRFFENDDPMLAVQAYGGTLLMTFCLLGCLGVLPRRTTIPTSAIATLAAYWLGFALCAFFTY